jgi:hypothetical protein
MPSLSEFYYTSQKNVLSFSLIIIGTLMMIDGLNYKTRRYNIIIGLAMLGVIAFPPYAYRIPHNTCAIIFFVGNAFIVTYHSRLLTINKKRLFMFIISTSLILLVCGVINVYVAETIGLFSMSYFMYIRYSMLELRDKLLG